MTLFDAGDWKAREDRIVRSGIRNTFTPHLPISDKDLLIGRQTEVGSIASALNTPGLHVVVFGERGVGKSSLTKVALSEILRSRKSTLVEKRCDSTDTFESVFRFVFERLGIQPKPGKVVRQKENKWTVTGGNAQLAQAQTAETEGDAKTTEFVGPAITPSDAANELCGLDAVVIVDEADALRGNADRGQLAETIKLLSDARSTLKIIVVGIAETCAALLNGHPSVQRNLREIHLRVISDPDIEQIIRRGAQRHSLLFENDVISRVVEMANGYPYFAHLLGLKCAESAIADGRDHIDIEGLYQACGVAASEAEASLRKQYESATSSYQTDAYAIVLRGAADLSKKRTFTAGDLRDRYATHTGTKISAQQLNAYLGRLADDDDSKVLKRVQKGIYRFSDPRMASYVMLRNFRK